MRSVSFLPVLLRFVRRLRGGTRRFGGAAAFVRAAGLIAAVSIAPMSIAATAAHPARAEEPAPAAPTSRLEALERDLAAAETAEAAAPIRRRLIRLRLISGSPTADLLVGRALAARATGAGGLALDLLDAAIVVAPDWAGGRGLRGAIHAERGAIGPAVADLGEALARDPADAQALVLLALLRERSGEKKAALDLLRRAAAADPNLPDLGDLLDRTTLEVEGQPL